MKYDSTIRNNNFARLFALLVIMLATFTARAADIRSVTLIVGSKPMVISLDAKPVITFSNNTLHITTEDEPTPTDVDVTQIKSFEFKGAPDRADANGDNDITAADIDEVANHIVGKKTANESWGADANGDNKIDAVDLSEIIRKVINKQ